MPIRRATAWRGGQVLTAPAMNGGVSGLLADLAGRSGVIEYEGSLAITNGDDGNRYLQLPVGTTAQRPATPLDGFLRYNSTTQHIEHWDSEANAWVSWPMVDDIDNLPVQVSGDWLVLRTNSGVYRSTDDGATWSSSVGGSLPDNMDAMSVDIDGAILVAHDDGRIWRSADDGASWSLATNGPSGSDNVEGLAVDTNGDWLLLDYSDGVYRSTDDGATWQSAIAKPSGASAPRGLAVDTNGDWLLLDYYNGVYRSTDDGATWQTAIAKPSGASAPRGLAVDTNGDWLLLDNDDGVYRSTDDGANWTLINNSRPSGTDSLEGMAVDTRQVPDLPMVTYANFNGNGAVGLQRNQVSQGTHVHTGTPDAPTDLAAVANQNSDQIKLTWTEPNHGGSPITGYRINQSGANVATYNITGSPTEWTTPTLTVGTYTFTVQAKNVNGNGAASASVSATINA